MEEEEIQPSDTFEQKNDAKSSSVVLAALKDAEKAFEKWQDSCRRIDDIYSKKFQPDIPAIDDWTDGELDLFWASYEILKPAVYAKPPRPVVSTQFKDRDKVKSKTAE